MEEPLLAKPACYINLKVYITGRLACTSSICIFQCDSLTHYKHIQDDKDCVGITMIKVCEEYTQ